MNAINHAATALVINRKWPKVPIIPVLISVQLVEILWVIFNLLGVERTTMNAQVLSMSDVHLSFMPYSHSIVGTVVLAVIAWLLVGKLLKHPAWAIAIAVGVCSHTVLDLLVHSHDIAIAPGIESPKFGTGLYEVPLFALAVETIYGVWCWYVFRGSKMLLGIILAFNIGAISFYSASVPGPEQLMAGNSMLFVGFIGFHIVTGLFAIWFFARQSWGVQRSVGPNHSLQARRP